MIATIVSAQKGYLAQFDRLLEHSIEEVWAVLTENEKLQKWMNHLEVVDLQKDGLIKFHYQDGTDNYEQMKITDFEDRSILEFEWGADIVRFELVSIEDGCLLILKEYITDLTDHTPKDLAGWHMCLESFRKVLDGESVENPTADEFEEMFEQYRDLVKEI